jgi:hypothetical protein
MQLHKNMVEIRLTWWRQMDFIPQHVEFGVKFSFLLKIMQLHEKMDEIHPIWWPPNGFCSPSC